MFKTALSPVRMLSDRIVSYVIDSLPLLDVSRGTVDIQQEALTPSERALKRAIDLGLSLIAVVMLLPLMAVTAIAIKLDSPGPVIFRQRRSGFNSMLFTILKFRTMRVSEDGPTIEQACRDDPRVTHVGRFLRRASIDELPQLFNVIKGEMSLVGPRPHALAHDRQYGSLISNYTLRYRVRPGITGWAQVNHLRGETSELEQMVNRIEFDLWYIKNWSISLDLYIIMRTCFTLLSSRAY